MSLLDVADHSNPVRIYPEGQPLPTQWDEFMVKRPTDTKVVHLGGKPDEAAELAALESAERHGVIEGVGFVMMDSSFEELSDRRDFLALSPELLEEIVSRATTERDSSVAKAA